MVNASDFKPMQNVSRSGGAPARAEASGNSGYTTRGDAKPADFLSILDAANNTPAEAEPVQANPSPLLNFARPAITKAATGITGKQTGKTLPGELPDGGKTISPKTPKDIIGGLTAEQAGATTHPVTGDDSDPEAAIALATTGDVAAPAAIAVLLGLTPPLAAQPTELVDTGASSITPRAPLPTLPETKAAAAPTTLVSPALVQAATKAITIEAAGVNVAQNNAPAAQSVTETVAEQVAAVRLAPVEVIAPKPVATEAALRAMPQAVEAKPAVQPAPAAMTLAQEDTAGDKAPNSTPTPQTAVAATKTAGDAPAAPAFASLSTIETPVATTTVATPASLRIDTAVVTSAASTPAAQAPHDFTSLVDRLVEAREAAQPNVIRTSLAHAEFGTVSLQFRQDLTHMNVTVAGADPGLATAVQAAAAASLAAGAGNDDGAAPRQDNAQSQQQNQQQQTASANSQGQQQSQARSEATAQRSGLRDQAGLTGKATEDPSGKSPAAPSTRRSGIFA
jgi:hypothetical protein